MSCFARNKLLVYVVCVVVIFLRHISSAAIYGAAHLQRSELQRSELQRSELQRSDLQRSELQRSDLQRSDLFYLTNACTYFDLPFCKIASTMQIPEGAAMVVLVCNNPNDFSAIKRPYRSCIFTC